MCRIGKKWGESLSFAFAGADIMKGDVSPQSVFHTNFHKGSTSQKAVIFPLSLKIDSLEQGISKNDAVLMKGFGICSGHIALFSRHIEQKIVAVKSWETACKMSILAFSRKAIFFSSDWFPLQVSYLLLKFYVNLVCLNTYASRLCMGAVTFITLS